MKWLSRTLLLLGVLTACQTFAQVPCPPEALEFPPTNACPTSGTSWNTTNTPLVDAVCTNGVCPAYNDAPYNDVISLYGTFGNSETQGMAAMHATTGVNLGNSVAPLCADHSTPPCANGRNPAIVAVIAGFSNCEIEVCGGDMDIWQDPPSPLGQPPHLFPGQPCATNYQGCPNLNATNPSQVPYNACASSDGTLQQSFLEQVYSPTPHLVGSHVVLFNAAVGNQALDHWDPFGVFASHNCGVPGLPRTDPVCDWDATAQALTNNKYDPWQVQVLYLKSSLELPQCSLKNQPMYCAAGVNVPTAFLEEQALGNILRYLKLGATVNGVVYPAPYPNLKQVFLSTRIYGGYANGTAHGCLSPEPYAYEEGFAVQRIIVAQINGVADSNGYSGSVDLNNAPWVDWGPYLWADGDKPRQSDQLFWCNGQSSPSPCSGKHDVRFGDPNNQTAYWGDFTHPTADGALKAAGQMVTFFTKDPAHGGSQYVQGWRQQ